MRWLLAGSLLVCAALLSGSGCGDKKAGSKSVPVSGKVNLDGKPLAEGDITFVGEPGSVPDTIQVTNGTFEGTARVGKRKVEIRAYKLEKPPPTATGGVTDSKVNYLPEQYNTRTTLTAEVTESGVNPNTFDVKSTK
jgi:hypothetical protein